MPRQKVSSTWVDKNLYFFRDSLGDSENEAVQLIAHGLRGGTWRRGFGVLAAGKATVLEEGHRRNDKRTRERRRSYKPMANTPEVRGCCGMFVHI